MLAVFAQFETDVRREGQAEGIAKVMADPQLRKSRYRGGTARIDPDHVQMLPREGLGPAAIAARMGISRMSVFSSGSNGGAASLQNSRDRPAASKKLPALFWQRLSGFP